MPARCETCAHLVGDQYAQSHAGFLVTVEAEDRALPARLHRHKLYIPKSTARKEFSPGICSGKEIAVGMGFSTVCDLYALVACA